MSCLSESLQRSEVELRRQIETQEAIRECRSRTPQGETREDRVTRTCVAGVAETSSETRSTCGWFGSTCGRQEDCCRTGPAVRETTAGGETVVESTPKAPEPKAAEEVRAEGQPRLLRRLLFLTRLCDWFNCWWLLCLLGVLVWVQLVCGSIPWSWPAAPARLLYFRSHRLWF